LANHCKKCGSDVSIYYSKIVGKKMGEDGDNEEESMDEVEYLNKKQKS